VRYYRDAQGWQLAHTVDRRGVTAYLLSRPAERRPDIADRITEQSQADAARRRSVTPPSAADSPEPVRPSL
jgi:hypothetical protein